MHVQQFQFYPLCRARHGVSGKNTFSACGQTKELRVKAGKNLLFILVLFILTAFVGSYLYMVITGLQVPRELERRTGDIIAVVLGMLAYVRLK
jgi:hypothetical protein